MKYGRLENGIVVEVIDHDPTGKYVDTIQWVELPEETLTTPEQHQADIEEALRVAEYLRELERKAAELLSLNNMGVVTSNSEVVIVGSLDANTEVVTSNTVSQPSE